MERIDRAKLPTHIAIIMDGNGRWATRHDLLRIEGHRKGAEAVRNVVKACRKIGIRYLTLYAFSVENWKRPEEEVKALMKLLEDFLLSQLPEMLENNIRLGTIGNIDILPETVKTTLAATLAKTSSNDGMVLNLALSYGSRDEIVDAVKKILDDCEGCVVTKEQITKDLISSYLYTVDMPDPDLLIRTSGEYRLSNFLLWQSAYTELYFTDILWPDFAEKDLVDIIVEFQKRERRFGLTSDQLA
jgi:undecaprenyl diphosphate synthase